MIKDFDSFNASDVSSEKADFFTPSGVSCDFAIARDGVDWDSDGKDIAKKIDSLWRVANSLGHDIKEKFGGFSGYVLHSDSIIVFGVNGVLLERAKIAFSNYSDSVSFGNGGFGLKIEVLAGNYRILAGALINSIEEYISVATSV